MKTTKLIFLLALGFCFQFCKKSEPGRPLTIISEETVKPPGYDDNLYHNKKVIATGFGYYHINDIIIDSTDHSKAYIIGNFASTSSTMFNIYANCIVKLNTTNNSFSTYPLSLYNASNYAEVTCLLQASNGQHYIGGDFINMDPVISTIRFGRKSPSSTAFSYSVDVNYRPRTIKEVGSNIYFSGDFYYLNNLSCSPILSFNTANNVAVSQFGSVASHAPTRMEYFNSEWFIAGTNVPTFVARSSGGNWLLVDNGFNGYCNDLAVFGGKLYAAGGMSSGYNGSGILNFVNEFNGTSWVRVGVNNLPSQCTDIEWYNNTLYACGANYIYKLDNADNKWKSVLQNGYITFQQSPIMIKFINGKLYCYDGAQLVELTK